jgi:hypothetical protein
VATYVEVRVGELISGRKYNVSCVNPGITLFECLDALRAPAYVALDLR